MRSSQYTAARLTREKCDSRPEVWLALKLCLECDFQQHKIVVSMCMGFGCNAAGVVGCRIIDSPRERLIAILTNNFVPCNGRFPPPWLE